jgi:8-oxo-dGTP diphosphatase
MDNDIRETYGNQLRVRACGICIDSNAILMVNHRGLTPTNNFWAPPGGGINFGATIHDTLLQEFEEETGLIITTGQFLFGCEYIQPPIHSVELFFQVHRMGGTLITGKDPELQIIKSVRFLTDDDIRNLHSNELHGIFRIAATIDELTKLRGFYSI